MSNEANPASTIGWLGKIGDATTAEAREASKRLRRKGKIGLHVYHCRKCGNAHLGRERRDGPPKELRRVPDTARDSFKNRKARYRELIR
jgi:hypothetical protein